MYVAEVLLAHFELKLPESFDEGHPLNVSDGATQLRGGTEKCETDCVLVKLTNTCYVYIYTYVQTIARPSCMCCRCNKLCVLARSVTQMCPELVHTKPHAVSSTCTYTTVQN